MPADDKTAECRPPPEHEAKEMHWIATGESFDVAGWTGSNWQMIGSEQCYSPAYLARLKIRYVGPAVPPGESNDDQPI